MILKFKNEGCKEKAQPIKKSSEINETYMDTVVVHSDFAENRSIILPNEV
jgi:hypothetical protein